MISGKLVVVEISTLLLMLAPDIDHSAIRVFKIRLGRLAPEDGRLMNSYQKATCKELVLMRTARMGQDGCEFSHWETRQPIPGRCKRIPIFPQYYQTKHATR